MDMDDQQFGENNCRITKFSVLMYNFRHLHSNAQTTDLVSSPSFLFLTHQGKYYELEIFRMHLYSFELSILLN